MQTDITNLLFSIIVLLLGGLGYLVKSTFERIDGKMNSLDASIGSIKVDIGELRTKMDVVWEKVFSKGAAPLVLNDHGAKILAESGIKELVDAHADALIRKLRERSPQNAYQIQEYSGAVVRALIKDQKNLLRLQEGAFKLGVNVEAALFAGGLYLRDLALETSPKLC